MRRYPRPWANRDRPAVIPSPRRLFWTLKKTWRIEMSASWSRVLGLMIVSSWLVVACSSAKKIEAGATCILNTDCNSPLVCSMDKCHDACHKSADCPAGESCITASDQSTVCQLPVETYCVYQSDCKAPL